MADRMEVDEPNYKRRGRGHQADTGGPQGRQDKYERIEEDADMATGPESVGANAARSVEGWVIMVTGVHEEATEEDVQDKFADFGDVKNLHLNLDRRTGYVKGYALVEFETRKEAEQAIKGANGTELLENKITCDFAFVRPPVAGARANGAGGGRQGSQQQQQRNRSQSPPLITRID